MRRWKGRRRLRRALRGRFAGASYQAHGSASVRTKGEPRRDAALEHSTRMEIDRLAQLHVAEAAEGATRMGTCTPRRPGHRWRRHVILRILPFAVSQLDPPHEGHRADDGGGCS
jgi:hypothetical protein